VSDALTFAAQRALQFNQPLAREFPPEMILRPFPVNGDIPRNVRYQRQMENNFANWRLPIEGMIARPGDYPLEFFKGFPARTQITQQSCEEGWTAIGQWTGVQLSRVLQDLGIQPQARYVVFEAADGWWESVDMADALHPQTLLAYGMNGGELLPEYGAPLRLRVERQLGYKNLKFLTRMLVTDRVDNINDGTGSGSHSDGYSWYAGI
jgi:DMSO/TMAO reductase YedYZ molybdopterin-dependent catalytic subunit